MNINISNPSEPGVYGGVDLYINGLPGFDDQKRELSYLPAFVCSQKEEIELLCEALDWLSDYERKWAARNLDIYLFALSDVIKDARLDGAPFAPDLSSDNLDDLPLNYLQQEILDLIDGMHAVRAASLSVTAQAVALIILCAKGDVMGRVLKGMKETLKEIKEAEAKEAEAEEENLPL